MGAPGSDFSQIQVFLYKTIFTNYEGSGGYIQVRLFKKSAFVEKGHMCCVYKYMYKGVETY